MDEIEEDLHRTFPGHAAFGAGGAGREKLRQVLANARDGTDRTTLLSIRGYVGVLHLALLLSEGETADVGPAAMAVHEQLSLLPSSSHWV